MNVRSYISIMRGRNLVILCGQGNLNYALLILGTPFILFCIFFGVVAHYVGIYLVIGINIIILELFDLALLRRKCGSGSSLLVGNMWMVTASVLIGVYYFQLSLNFWSPIKYVKCLK